MAQYVKKPVIINAWKHDGTKPISIRTLEGVTVASPGDWIIIGVEGETYACKETVFKTTYEPIA